jgi:hypothetical protein
MERATGRAWEALDRAGSAETTPPWLQFVTPAEITCLSAKGFNVLGRYDAAATSATAALADYPRRYPRSRVHCVLHRVEANLGRREVDQAAADATGALQLAHGIRSNRLALRLRGVRDRMTQWPEVGAARDWIEHYETVVPSP